MMQNIILFYTQCSKNLEAIDLEKTYTLYRLHLKKITYWPCGMAFIYWNV